MVAEGDFVRQTNLVIIFFLYQKELIPSFKTIVLLQNNTTRTHRFKTIL